MVPMSVLAVHDGTSVSVHLYITHTLHKVRHWHDHLSAPAPLYQMDTSPVYVCICACHQCLILRHPYGPYIVHKWMSPSYFRQSGDSLWLLQSFHSLIVACQHCKGIDLAGFNIDAICPGSIIDTRETNLGLSLWQVVWATVLSAWLVTCYHQVDNDYDLL